MFKKLPEQSWEELIFKAWDFRFLGFSLFLHHKTFLGWPKIGQIKNVFVRF